MQKHGSVKLNLGRLIIISIEPDGKGLKLRW